MRIEALSGQSQLRASPQGARQERRRHTGQVQTGFNPNGEESAGGQGWQVEAGAVFWGAGAGPLRTRSGLLSQPLPGTLAPLLCFLEGTWTLTTGKDRGAESRAA